ncbi:hypothetical protein HYU17_03675 [Candidatus Woesearchaeota archaeon]|nr:hypothetical protein [Candidatus Woesearchaeota archaeon]
MALNIFASQIEREAKGRKQQFLAAAAERFREGNATLEELAADFGNGKDEAYASKAATGP